MITVKWGIGDFICYERIPETIAVNGTAHVVTALR